MTCLLPPMKYDEQEAIDVVNRLRTTDIGMGRTTEIYPERDTCIYTRFHSKGWLITFPFQVKTEDEIKCYLFWNGPDIR